MLVGLEVNDIFKNGPFADDDISADLLFRQTIDDIHQRFVLVLHTC